MQNDTAISEPQIVWGLATRALPGQAVSGDLHLVKGFGDGVLLAAIDGLGHGEEAVAAAQTAAAILEAGAGAALEELFRRCHAALLRARGVVMTLATLRFSENRLTWLGVGNVEAVLLRAGAASPERPDRALLRSGIVGYQLPELRASTLPIERNDVLVFATDGVKAGSIDAVTRSDAPQEIADRILEQSFKGTDDALVLVVCYLGPGHE